MSTEPLVSAIIPTYKRPHLVTQAVHSILTQTPALEVIVVVDGPDAATLDSLHSIRDARLRVHVLPHNGGLSNARNTGVELANGRWVAFLDDDDTWLPRKLELQLAVAQCSHP